MRDFLKAPFLTAQAAAAAAVAEKSAQPVRLAGGPGCGAYRVARALHRSGDPGGFVSVRRILGSAEELERRVAAAVASDSSAGAMAVYVERIECQPPEIQELLLRWVDEGFATAPAHLPIRLLAQSDAPPDRPLTSLLPDLRRRLSAHVIALPRLRDRVTDLASIAAFLVVEAARALGKPVPTLTDAAIAHLASEIEGADDLEALLERLVARGDLATIDALDLGLGPVTAESPPKFAKPPSATEPPYRLDALITELAHELKNPMVTIKTFAQHMDHLLENAELREKFARLTNEAIDRMDGYLDELLQFSRFTTPNPRPTSLGELLAQALSGVEPRVREQVQLNGVFPGVRVHADEDQLVFALRALVRGLARELPADTGIVLDTPQPGTLVLHARGAGNVRTLQSVLNHDSAGESETSLHVALAEALIRRNGGTCRVVRGSDSVEVRLSLPIAE